MQMDPSTREASRLHRDSTDSINSSIYSYSADSFGPSRTSTVSSSGSSVATHSSISINHKGGKSDLSTITSVAMSTESHSGKSNAAATYSDVRRSLRPLKQAPGVLDKVPKQSVFNHMRSYTIDDAITKKENLSMGSGSHVTRRPESEIMSKKDLYGVQISPQASSSQDFFPITTSLQQQSPSEQPYHSHSLYGSQIPTLTATLSGSELETFKKSSTGHLRTLSKFARSEEGDGFTINSSTPSVIGLLGRRRLKRVGSATGSSKVGASINSTSAWAAGNWIDKQRQFLQAYEYLCHIGEAKEWIEEVIQKQIPPIVELEEALRNGVTLAEIVQAMYPNRPLRIFRHPKLQYRHSDNIALFFRFLDEVELPDLFRFELIDLYEKKNLPKVIHCIHALSWLLLKKGLVDFRMGNLVGQLEFEHHELEKTQKGLDKAGISMPSFAGMAANFGAEPEPEPESEEDRIQRQLYEDEASIFEFQAQIRGAMLRLQLGSLMSHLWDFESSLIDLQSRIRGDWARQVIGYRLGMRLFATNLQAICRGYLSRHRGRNGKARCKAHELNILQLQAHIRGSKIRDKVMCLRNQMLWQEVEIRSIQAALRGALQRKAVYDIRNRARKAGSTIELIQAAIRGAMRRKSVHGQCVEAQSAASDIKVFQASIRGALKRKQLDLQYKQIKREENSVGLLQAVFRGMLVRRSLAEMKGAVHQEVAAIVSIQAGARAMATRDRRSQLEKAVAETEDKDIDLQATIRGMLFRMSVARVKDALYKETSAITSIQAGARAMAARNRRSHLEKAVAETEDKDIDLQAIIRGMLFRKYMAVMKDTLHGETSAITSLQSGVRAMTARNRRSHFEKELAAVEDKIINLQAVIRGSATRGTLLCLRKGLRQHASSLCDLQSILRAISVRLSLSSQRTRLIEEDAIILDLQSVARGATLRRQLAVTVDFLQDQEHEILELQALSRAAILRIDVGGILEELESHEYEIVELQALARAMIVRISVDEVLTTLEEEEDTVTGIQAEIRGAIIRARFEEKHRYYRENMEKVIKAQSFIRGRIQGQAYKSLTTGENPPVGTVKGFVHLLNDSDFDFDEEVEFERLRKVVVQQVRQNELAEQYVSQLDIKIALLVKNKITLDEVVKHQKHFGGHIGSLLSNTDISSKDPFDLKALNKASRKKLEHYQVFFSLLQTQSQYLARLFRRLRELNTADKEYERVRHLIMGLFGYSQKRREEYYLIKLLARSAKEEIENFESLSEYLRCNCFWSKLFSSYVKSPRDRKFMRDVLGPIVREYVVENPKLNLESDPAQIYRSSINNEELRTGRRSLRQLDLPREEAIKDPETRATFIKHLQDLRDIADQFFSALEELLNHMPYGIRYIMKQMYEYLTSQLPNDDPGLVLQSVGYWVWRNYFQPAVIEPDRHGVIDRGLTQEQRRNLSEIAKVVTQVVSGRLFGAENIYLQPLNTYVGDSVQRLGQIWAKLILVPDAETYFDIDEFNDLYAKTKPTLYIKMSDIFSIHQLVASEISHICPNPDDILREIVRDLGNVKSNESELRNVSSTEISLTLNPRLAQIEDPEADIKALFMETKRYILYIIRVQTGSHLMEIMVKPPTHEDEERWQALKRDELSANNSLRSAYSEANALVDISSLSYAELKRMALENILHLEQTGKIRRDNHYQDLLNAIAIDIRTKHRRRIQRQRELEGTRLTIGRLNDQAVYLDQQLKTYNDYIEQAMVTLQNKKGKKRFLMPFTKQWEHQRELQKSGRVFKFGSYKYSARSLADRGVMVYWRGYSERHWDRVDLTISSNEVGVFTLDGSSGNMMIPGANAQVPLDDLLQAQYNNMQFLDFFDGHLRVNVNLFLHLIMRKFCNE